MKKTPIIAINTSRSPLILVSTLAILSIMSIMQSHSYRGKVLAMESSPINLANIAYQVEPSEKAVLLQAVFSPSSVAKVGGAARLRVSLAAKNGIPEHLIAKVNIFRADAESVSLLHFSQTMEVPLIPGQTTYKDSDL